MSERRSIKVLVSEEEHDEIKSLAKGVRVPITGLARFLLMRAASKYAQGGVRDIADLVA